MATQILRPDSDTTPNAWATVSGCTLHHDCVDEVCTQPNTGCLDGNYLSNGELNPGAIEEFGMDNVPSDVDEITAINCWVYGGSGLTATSVSVRHWVSTLGWHATTKYLSLQPPGLGPGWVQLNSAWTGLTYTKAQGDSIIFELTSNAGAKLSGTTVQVFYAVITYTPTVGYEHDVIGVSATSIGKVCGVSTANIEKIIGV